MLRIVTGPFHPNLEQALADDLRQYKAADPLASIAIVVPSSLLVTRLRELLVLEQGLPLLNVHVLTFHQFALRLYDEQRALLEDEPRARPVTLVSDLFFEEVLSRMAQTLVPGGEALSVSSLAPGAWTALWATIRDLKDASVDPGTALRGVAEGLFESEDAPALRNLFTLYAALLVTARLVGAAGAEDVSAAVVPWVPASRFLAGLGRICYYGFYDLTQVQLSLFEQVVRHASVTLYFPLSSDPAYSFAQRFFDRHLQLLVSSTPQAVPSPTRSAPIGSGDGDQPQVCIISTIGSDDELTIACKEILTLVETGGYRFEEIGVVARTLEPYRNHLRRTFDQHRIPFVTTAVGPVMQEPVAKAVVQLAQLSRGGFYRATVMDLVTSPYYRWDPFSDERVTPRPDLWQVIVRTLGITRGEEEWHRLETAPQVTVWAGGTEDSDDETGGPVNIPPEQVRLLAQVVSRLIQDCRALPAQGGIRALGEAFAQLLARHLAIPGLTTPMALDQEGGSEPAPVGRVIQTALYEIGQLDRLGDVVSWDKWSGLLARALERTTMPIEATLHPGVKVLDAMTARGLPFRALFLLGLNEKVFPRFIREDAFLRDRHRRVLDVTMGYKIDEKLAGYDEEQLLFALLRGSARQRLYLMFQRAEEDGRPLVPSAYLADIQRTGAPAGRSPDWTVPRRLSGRLTLPWFAPPWLTREELAQWLVLRRQEPSSILEACGLDAELFRNGWATLRALEGGSHRLGAHDGLLSSTEAYWGTLRQQGIAPTPLEQYARCPFQYFGIQVLGLTSLRQRERENEALPAWAFGELCHRVLRLSHQRLVGKGWPDHPMDQGEILTQLGAAVEETFGAYGADHGTGYALTWQMAKETVLALAHEVLTQDEREFQASGFRPTAFEVEAEGMVEGLMAPGRGSVRVRGRLDRVDARTDPPGIRIVDYKFRQSRTMKSQDRDLLTSALRGFRLQPPLYALMSVAQTSGGRGKAGSESRAPSSVQFLFLAPRWDPPVAQSQFDPAAWTGPARQQLKRTLRTLLEGIRKGQFFIFPDGYCDHCELSPACRRFHGPTWWRAHSAAPAKQLRLIRKQKVPRG
jgi:ATP-dependent helicase/nuclease subunit B